MSAVEKGQAAILAVPGSADFDDIGALVVAVRKLLEDGGQIPAADARHLYVLATMAEAAWRRLDDAMTGAGK